MIDLHACSKIALGGGAFSGDGRGYGFGPIDDEEISLLLKEANDYQVNVIDLAPVYGHGMAEKRLGKILRDTSLREKYFLISKGGVTWHQSKRIDINISPAVLKKMLNQSLSDLQTDVLDAYFIHWPDPRHSMDEAIEFLQQCKQEGKFRFLGLGNVSEDMAKTYLERYDCIDCIQNEHNLFNSYSGDMLRLAFNYNIKLFGWGTLDKGILSRRVFKGREFHQDDCRSYAPWWNKKDVERKIEFIQNFLQQNTPQEESDMMELIWSFLNLYPSITSIIGFKSYQDFVSFMKVEKKLSSAKSHQFHQEQLEQWYKMLKQK